MDELKAQRNKGGRYSRARDSIIYQPEFGSSEDF